MSFIKSKKSLFKSNVNFYFRHCLGGDQPMRPDLDDPTETGSSTRPWLFNSEILDSESESDSDVGRRDQDPGSRLAGPSRYLPW